MVTTVFHFNREIVNSHSIPFRIPIHSTDNLLMIKRRIQSILQLSDKEWEKIKFAVVTNRLMYPDDDGLVVGEGWEKDIQIGLDHPDKSATSGGGGGGKKNGMWQEKAIKIHN